MSHLTDLLNPAPSPQPQQRPQASRPRPLSMDAQSSRRVRKDSVTSPGLEALAAAASTTAPLMSPSHSKPFGQTGFQETTFRLPSGHGESPSFSPHHQTTFSPGLAQYHHATQGERKASISGDYPQTLAPLQPHPVHQSDSLPIIEPSEQTSQITFNGYDVTCSERPLHAFTSDQVSDEQISSPTTAQIRQPSPGPPMSVSAASVPVMQSEQVQVKTELNDTPMQDPQDGNNIVTEHTDVQVNTPDVKPDASTATSSTKAEEASDKASLKPKAPPSKKRAAPKKGTASSVKPAAKKRKLEGDSMDGSPSRGTPATSRASATPVPKTRKQDSATPTRSSSMAGQEDDDYEDDTQLFCICRKPDDHGVMIGCDGPCDDWFHLKCVEMTQAKTKLVQKWYCPNCAALGNETLWKRMCRLPGCSEPARQDEKGKHVSKYCSDDHATDFMRKMVYPNGEAREKTGGKKKAQSAAGSTQEHEDEGPVDLRGGTLRPAELKALVDGVKTVGDFRSLGDGVLSPPKTASPDAEGPEKVTITYTEEERAELEHIAQKKKGLVARRAMLNDRDKFVAMVETRHKLVLAELREKDKSLKDVCGYDARLTWCDEEFDQWRSSSEGQQALKSGILEPPPKSESAKAEINGTAPEEDGGDDELGRGVCKKKRCERHRAWLKNQQQDNAFERDQTRQGLRRLEHDEKGVRDRAMIRSLEEEEKGDEGIAS